MEIIPAVMPDSFSDLEQKLSLVSNLVLWVQIDVMDGRFVESQSWPYQRENDQDFSRILKQEEGLPSWQKLNFEIDLMVDNPKREASNWINAGASRLVIHLESLSDNLVSLLEELKGAQVEIGLALDTETPLEKVWPFLDYIDFVQLMGIKKIGYQGQPFDREVIERLKNLKKKSPSTLLSVDGGLNSKTAPAIVAAGADRLIIGSAIFESGDVAGAIREFQKL
jgi:ribulose-phosphate 3-epimerase